jgi:uncharacterized membrane protein
VTGVPPEVTVYLAAVRMALADLPEEERDDLLTDVRASLVEAAAESGGNIAARLGPPEEFAAELRAAAGLHAPAPARARRGVVDIARRLAGDPQLRRLAPIWWLVRAYVAVAAIALLVGAKWSLSYAVIPRLGSGALGLVAIAAAAVVSIWLGLRGRSRWMLELALVVAAIPVVGHLAQRPTPPVRFVYIETVSYGPGLTYNGAPLNNIYPYSRDGHLLHDVLLYTGAGTPIDAPPGVADPERRVVRTRLGKPIFNAFPVRYYEPGTRRVAHPDASPRVKIPRLLTPALRSR